MLSGDYGDLRDILSGVPFGPVRVCLGGRDPPRLVPLLHTPLDLSGNPFVLSLPDDPTGFNRNRNSFPDVFLGLRPDTLEWAQRHGGQVSGSWGYRTGGGVGTSLVPCERERVVVW